MHTGYFGTNPSDAWSGFATYAARHGVSFSGYSSQVIYEDYNNRVKPRINNNQPFMILFMGGPYAGALHWCALRGYGTESGTNYIFVNNPWQLTQTGDMVNWIDNLSVITFAEVWSTTPATINGQTREASGTTLGNVTVGLDGKTYVVSDTQGNYQITILTTGIHTLVASKTNFRSYTRTLNVTSLDTVYTLNFKGIYGLIPNDANLTFVLSCINKWKYPPPSDPELGLNLTKVLSTINAWKFPKAITLSPTGGAPGTQITVSGTNFPSSTSGSVWFDSNSNSIKDAGEPQADVNTNSSGVFGVALTVPSVAAGTYQVYADILGGSTAEASKDFVVGSTLKGDMPSGGTPPRTLLSDNATRHLPATPVSAGQTFQVNVSFTATADEFNSAGISDFAPAGWSVTTGTGWCTPSAIASNVINNKAEYAWGGPYTNGRAFTAVYEVTVPPGTASGTYSFSNGTFEYYIGESGPTTEGIGGDTMVTVQ